MLLLRNVILHIYVKIQLGTNNFSSNVIVPKTLDGPIWQAFKLNCSYNENKCYLIKYQDCQKTFIRCDVINWITRVYKSERIWKKPAFRFHLLNNHPITLSASLLKEKLCILLTYINFDVPSIPHNFSRWFGILDSTFEIKFLIFSYLYFRIMFVIQYFNRRWWSCNGKWMSVTLGENEAILKICFYCIENRTHL